MGADTIGFKLTVLNVGAPTIRIKETLIAAGDPLVATIPFSLFINGDGSRSPTLRYKLSVIAAGVPTISIAYTLNAMNFVFQGMPPVCDISTPFVFSPAPLAPNTPTGLAGDDRIVGPAIPEFVWQEGAGAMAPTIAGLHRAINTLAKFVTSMGFTLKALRDHVNKQAQKKPQQGSNFVEVRGSRITSKHRIFNPNDNTQFVDIVQIDAVQWRNKAGQTIIWRR